jgi:hypothetical protein
MVVEVISAIPWLSAVRGGIALTQLALLLPKNERDTAQYLYREGFFGSGNAAQARLDKALGLNAILTSLNGLPNDNLDKFNRERDAETLREALVESGYYASNKSASERLIKLVKNPPDIEKALDVTKKTGGFMDRLIGALTFGRFGASHGASKAWTDIVALKQAYEVIHASRSQQILEGTAAMTLEDRLAQPELRWKQAGQMDFADASPVQKAMEHLDVAMFVLKNPGAFRSVIGSHKETIELGSTLLLDARAKQTDSNPISLTFGEILSNANIAVDNVKRPMDYKDIRAVMDIGLLRQTAESLKLIKDHTFPLMDIPSDANQPGVMNLLSDQLRKTAEHLGRVTESLNNMPNEWERHVREDDNAINTIRDAKDVARKSYAAASGYGFNLARQALRLSRELDDADRYSPEMKAEFLTQVKELNTRLTEFHRDMHYLQANSMMLTEFAMKEAMGENVRLKEKTPLRELSRNFANEIDEVVPAGLQAPRGNYQALVDSTLFVGKRVLEKMNGMIAANISERNLERLGFNEREAKRNPQLALAASREQIDQMDEMLRNAHAQVVTAQAVAPTVAPTFADSNVKGKAVPQTTPEGHTLH